MATATVQELRQQLRKKFPQAHLSRLASPDREKSGFAFGDPNSFPAGAISEIVPEDSSPVLGLILAQLLGEPAAADSIPDFILIDGDGFDPGSFTSLACSRLLWVRCHQVSELMRAADLLIRDGNIPFILLDLGSFPERELQGLPASSWWRLKQIAARGGSRLLVLSPFPLVPCATLRLSLSSGLSLEDFDRPQDELFEQLHVHQQRLRHAT